MAFASPTAPLRRGCVLLIICVVFTSISCFGATAFRPVESTPYDRQMVRVFPVLNSFKMERPDSNSLSTVSHLMLQLRDMPYQHSSRWQTPMEVDLAQAGDCKGKALALYAQMRRNGAKNVRVIIGRRNSFGSGTHAWLEWQTREGSYVLDPTFNDMPTKTAELSLATYVPLYAYDGAHKYRANTESVAPSAKVATVTYVPARATQPLELNGQQIVSNAWRSPNVEGVRRATVIAATSKAKSVTSTYRKGTLTQKGHVRHRRHVASNAARLRHVRTPVISQNERFVIPMDSTRLPPLP